MKSEDYESKKADKIIFSYHIFTEDYIDTKLTAEDKKRNSK
jgi:hypothetical protein